MRRRAMWALVGLVGTAAPLSGQSIFSAAGLGLPIESLDARARALGSFGVGLAGGSLLPADPAAAARILLPQALMVAQPSWVQLSESGTTDRTYIRGTRFPLIAVGYPLGGGLMTLSGSSVFDQRYRGSEGQDIVVGVDTVAVTDRFAQDGSLSSLAFGYSRMVTQTTSVGLSIGRYAGSVTRSLLRTFDSVGGVTVDPYSSAGSWRYAGTSVTAGVASDLTRLIRVAGSATWSSDLDANATGSTAGGDAVFSMPLQLRVGATSVLVPGLVMSASGIYADWSDTSAASTSGGSVFGVGVGLEFARTRFAGRDAPLRFGFRRAGLPFSLGTESAHEQTFSGGLALVLNQSGNIVVSSADLAVEKGTRSGGSFEESFWRATASVRIAAF